jgi:hypothetical protein
MTYIYYANEYSEAGEILNQMLQSAFSKRRMKRCRTIAELTKRLHEPVYDVSVVVLLIENSIELEQIIALKDVLWDIKLITILSSQASLSQKELLTLRPRFMTWTDSDFSHVVEVLGNMMKCRPERKVAIANPLTQIIQKN